MTSRMTHQQAEKRRCGTHDDIMQLLGAPHATSHRYDSNLRSLTGSALVDVLVENHGPEMLEEHLQRDT